MAKRRCVRLRIFRSMRTEEQAKSYERYFVANEYFSNSAIAMAQADCIELFEEAEGSSL